MNICLPRNVAVGKKKHVVMFRQRVDLNVTRECPNKIIVVMLTAFVQMQHPVCVQSTSASPAQGNSFHPFELGPAFLLLSSGGEAKVASYVTKRHFTAVKKLMYEE